MKRFRFPLRPIAVIRAHAELRARETLAAAVHAYVAAEEQLAGTRARAARLAEALAEHRSGLFAPVEAAATFRAYRAECDEEIQAERRVIEARETMQRRRREYFAAHRELKAVQRLEDKARAAFRLEAGRAEQAVIDEFAGLVRGRRAAIS